MAPVFGEGGSLPTRFFELDREMLKREGFDFEKFAKKVRDSGSRVVSKTSSRRPSWPEGSKRLTSTPCSATPCAPILASPRRSAGKKTTRRPSSSRRLNVRGLYADIPSVDSAELAAALTTTALEAHDRRP